MTLKKFFISSFFSLTALSTQVEATTLICSFDCDGTVITTDCEAQPYCFDEARKHCSADVMIALGCSGGEDSYQKYLDPIDQIQFGESQLLNSYR